MIETKNRQPIIHPIVDEYIAKMSLDDVTKNGSYPCKILFPKIFGDNIQTLKNKIDTEMIDYKIYFANKATKAVVFVRTALENNIGIDVSSEQELQDVINVGYKAQDIIANGPKSRSFIRLCLKCGVMISVDSIHEIKKIVEMQVDSQSKIMIRIRPPHHLSPSRFGISQEEIRSHQSLIMQLGSIYRIYGLHFHIDSINAEDKKQIIRHLIHVREKLLARDISIEQIGIGGGFGVQYVENLLYQQTQKEYPQNKRSYGTDTVQELLDTEIEQGLSFAQYLRESMTILHLEPGRSLLDQCGICIHHIIDKKNNQLFIDGNMYSLGSIGQEMPHDPLIYKKSIDGLSQDYREYEIYGNLCMEFDRIYTRNIILPKNIELGDMLIFINIAAYFVDFSDSQPIKHNKRREIIV